MGWWAPTHAERKFALPPQPRVPLWAWVVALTVHAVFAILWVSEPHGYDPSRRSPWREFVSTTIGLPAREVAMRFDSRRARHVVSPLMESSKVVAVAPTPLPILASAPVSDTVLTAGEDRIGPHHAQGRVWVRPLPEAPKQLAAALTGRPEAQLADSVVNEMVQVYLEAMAKEAEGQKSTPPSWTTKVAGQLVGLDAKWIYLGPLKIPTVLLALLPINLQGNPTQADMHRKLSVMRQDLFDAARRADNLAEFKQAVKALRQETQRQKDFARNQRTVPDSSRP